MDCPVCKYPNPQGATHCGMCYEVFNRSAAQAYLHAVKRERRQEEGIPEEADPVIKSQRVVENAQAVVAKVDWKGLADSATSLIRRFWKVPVIGAGLIALWMLVSFLFSASLWYHLFGKKLVYSFSDQAPTQYLVGTKQHIKSWSERQGRLDTPLEDFNLNEMGNIVAVKSKAADKNRQTVFLRAKEWVQFLNDTAGAASRTLPMNHPTLAGARLVFDRKGSLEERHLILSPRLAKGVLFFAPKFPKGSLKEGRTWDEAVEWTDLYNDWKMNWSGTLHWTIGDLEPCGEDTCVRLSYTADLRPRLNGWPSWAKNSVHHAEATVSGDGAALFDAGHKHLLSNTFSYDGLLHIPITDLGRIPWELRVGRRVKGPGEIVIRFENKIDLRKN
jgi:hypothetical protein